MLLNYMYYVVYICTPLVYAFSPFVFIFRSEVFRFASSSFHHSSIHLHSFKVSRVQHLTVDTPVHSSTSTSIDVL